MMNPVPAQATIDDTLNLLALCHDPSRIASLLSELKDLLTQKVEIDKQLSMLDHARNGHVKDMAAVEQARAALREEQDAHQEHVEHVMVEASSVTKRERAVSDREAVQTANEAAFAAEMEDARKRVERQLISARTAEDAAMKSKQEYDGKLAALKVLTA